MVTQLKSLGRILDINDIKSFLFQDESEPLLWFEYIQFSMSPCGDVASFLYKNKLVVTKLVNEAALTPMYKIVHKGFLTDTETDMPTCVLSLSIALQQKSVGTTTTIKTSTWNCIAVGYSSGFLRIYTETGTQLFEQIFHPKPINLIKYCHPKVLQDELLIIHPDIIVAVDGFSLYQCLRFCRIQQMRTTSPNNSKNINITYKKWLLQDQTSTFDVEFYGVRNTTPFEHLFQASLAGGSSQYAGHAGLGPVYNYLAVGKDPFIAQYCPSEHTARPIMSEVVMSVATKLMSYIPGSSWLAGWAQPDKDTQNFEPPIGIIKNICINDPRRAISSIRASPKGNLAVLSDTFGRLLLLDVTSMIIVNIWKGYRGAQCGWLLVPGCTDNKSLERPQNTLFLVIYAKKRGILEVWCPYQHYRVAAFNAGKKGILISNMFSALGEGSLSSPLDMPPWRPSKSCCMLLNEDGSMINIDVPFENCLGIEFMLSIEDGKILDHIYDVLRKPSLSVDEETELGNVIIELQLGSSIIKLFSDIYQMPSISFGFKGQLSKTIMEEIANEKELYCQPDFIHLHQVCKTFLKILALFETLSRTWKTADYLSSSTKSPALNEVQDVLQAYFTAAEIDNSFDHPQFVTFYNSFTHQNSAKSIEEDVILCIYSGIQPEEYNKFVKFLVLPLLFSEDWENVFNNLVQFAGISTESLLTMFVEACLMLDIQITSEEYEDQITTVIRHFKTIYGSTKNMWSTFFHILKSNNNVCQGFVLAVYNQKVAVDTLEFTALTLGSEKEADDEEECQEWVALSPEHEQWYNIRQQLWDVLHLQMNTDAKCTINMLLSSNNNTVTHVVSKYIIDNDLVQNFIDWVERCKNHESDEDEDDSDEEMFDDALNWLMNITPLWPYQLDPNSISICLVECLIVCWSEVLETSDGKSDAAVAHLISAADVIFSLTSVSLQYSLVHVLWETVFCTKLKKLYLMVEKIGRQPKDRMCSKELHLNLSTCIKFVSIARHLFVNMNISDKYSDDKFTIKQENVWVSDKRTWLLNNCAAGCCKINSDLIILHAQLLSTLEFIIVLNIKNIRPSTLFHPKYHTLFFIPLSSPGAVTFASTPEIDNLREQFLKLCVKSSVCTELDIIPYHSSWTNLIVSVASLWECVLQIQSYLSVFLYSLGKFDEADELIITSSHRQLLGLDLLNVLLAQLEMLIYFDETSQKLFLPVLTPSLSSWLRTKHDPSKILLDIKVVFKTFCKVLTWVEGDDQMTRNSKELRLNLFKVL